MDIKRTNFIATTLFFLLAYNSLPATTGFEPSAFFLGEFFVMAGYAALAIVSFKGLESKAAAISTLVLLAGKILLMISPYTITVRHIFEVVGVAVLLLVILAQYTDIAAGFKETSEKIFFLPAGLALIGGLYASFGLVVFAISHGSSAFLLTALITAFWAILEAAGLLTYAMFVVFGLPVEEPEEHTPHVFGITVGPTEKLTYEPVALPRRAFIKMGKHVLLLFLTLGIWFWLWVYRTTDVLNVDRKDEPRHPLKKLALCMFVPLYVVYWSYKSAQRVDRIAKSNGIRSDITNLCLVLAMLLPFITPIVIQSKINTIVTTLKLRTPSHEEESEEADEYDEDTDEEPALPESAEAADNGDFSEEAETETEEELKEESEE